MSREERHESVRELLEGLLDPAEAARVRERIAADPGWARAYRRERAVLSLLQLSLDVEPPPDLVPGVLARIAAERDRRAARFRLPARLENLLVVSGAGALAALVAVISQAAGAGFGWLGPATVVSARLVTGSAEALADLAASAVHLDWVARLLATLSDALRTVVTTTAPPLLAVTLVAFACTLALAWVLVRTGKAREGALSHVHWAL